jgi:hypothetical protein
MNSLYPVNRLAQTLTTKKSVRGLCRTSDFVIVQGQSDIGTGAY